MAQPLPSIETTTKATPSRQGRARPRIIIAPRLLDANSDGTRLAAIGERLRRLGGHMTSTTVTIDDGRGLPRLTEILLPSAALQIPMHGPIRGRFNNPPIEPPAPLEGADLAHLSMTPLLLEINHVHFEVFGRPRKQTCLNVKAQ